MCQVYGPTPLVACSKCGAGYYENASHTCKIFVAFEEWDAQLQKRASQPYTGDNHLLSIMRAATKSIAAWPLWKRHYVWAEEFQFSVKGQS
jgi:hypothetical protein